MDTDNITGQTEAILRVLSKRDCAKVMVCGKKDQEPATNTKGNTRLIRSTVMGYSRGLPVTSIKEITRMI